MAVANSTSMKAPIESFDDRCALTIRDIADTTDKFSMNLSYVKSHLSVISRLLEGSNDSETTDAEVMSHAARHFVDMLEADIKALYERSKQGMEA